MIGNIGSAVAGLCLNILEYARATEVFQCKLALDCVSVMLWDMQSSKVGLYPLFSYN